MTSPRPEPVSDGKLRALGAGWFLVALFIGETGLLAALPAPAPQVVMGSITAGLVACAFGVGPFRAWALRLPVRALVAVHLTRFVGWYFLFLQHQGELPATFAIPAGWGDIMVATGAAVLLVLPRALHNLWLVTAWNTIALADILFVLASGLALEGAERYALMDQLTKLPLSFLPTMIVPLILCTHILIYARVWRAARSSTPLDEVSYARSRPVSM